VRQSTGLDGDWAIAAGQYFINLRRAWCIIPIGVQYGSSAYRQRLAQAGVIPSMSRAGNCYDNAILESFWSSLKREAVPDRLFAARTEVKAAIFEWIEILSNRERFRCALGCQSPVDFETKLNQKWPCFLHPLPVHQIKASPRNNAADALILIFLC